MAQFPKQHIRGQRCEWSCQSVAASRLVSLVLSVTTSWQCCAAHDLSHDTWLKVSGVGHVQGTQYPSRGLSVFASIPYAEAPVDDLRWRRPRPLPHNDGHMDARTFGPACPQELHGHVIGDENCLTLNVFAPSQAKVANASLPVMVWFHGGGYSVGTANVDLNGTWGPLYSGEALAAGGAVVVTVQYRLGVLGFLALPGLRERDELKSSGNYGIQDQRLALQWVRQHISSFGGDPNRVLIFGQSAGAGSVNWHLVAEASRGLFQAAALESGACAPWAAQKWRDTEATSHAVLRLAKCANVSCLLGKTTQELTLASGKVEDAGQFWAPTVDGVELTELPCIKMEKGGLVKVPIIVGYNRDESFPSSPVNLTEEDFDIVMQKEVPKSLRHKIKAEYSARYTDWFWAKQQFEADKGITCPTRRFARAAEASGSTVFAYKFSRQPHFPIEFMMGDDIAPRHLWGAFHGAELAYVFGNPRIGVWNLSLTQEDLQLSSTINKHWLSLARTGEVASDWPALTGADPLVRKWLLLDSGSVTVSEAQLLSQCDAIDEIGRFDTIIV